jgi:hypothetical protein
MTLTFVAMLRFEGREQAGRRNVEGAGITGRRIRQGKLLMNQGCTEAKRDDERLACLGEILSHDL